MTAEGAMADDPLVEVLALDHPDSVDPARVGFKAARLAALLREGLPIPSGFVCTVDASRRFYLDNGLDRDSPPAAFEASTLSPTLSAKLHGASPGPWAVRSSAVDEDAAGASYAGLYCTILGVDGGDALCEAVRRCWAAIASSGLQAYASAHQGDPEPRLALLVQRQVTARVAGVACSVDPLTGEDTVVLSAVRGSGAPLLGGVCDGETWLVPRDGALRRPDEAVLSAEEALKVAVLVRSLATRLGAPQEIEWAFEGDQLHLLQCRPVTGLPANVTWSAPLPGAWLRNIRLGEWLGAPVTPLMASWLLPAIERGASAFRRRWVGLPMPDPPSVLVHGWYFATVEYVPRDGAGVARMIARMALHLARHPRRGSMVFMGPLSDPATRLGLREWDEVFVPRLQRIVREGERRLPELDRRQTGRLLDGLIEAAGEGFGLLSGVSGAAWKAELLLAEHYRRYVEPSVGGSAQLLLCGFGASTASGHTVFSLDWSEPTGSELALESGEGEVSGRLARAVEERQRARERVLRALAFRPLAQRRFEHLLTRATELARRRSRCVEEVTRGWPLMRRALLALGAAGARDGSLERPEDVFFLDRAEITSLFDGKLAELRPAVTARRAAHRQQRRLTPPLELGELPAPFRRALEIAEALRGPPMPAPGERLRGLPASPGRARGCVRVVRTPADLAQLRADEVLVAPLLAPAWVPLAARACAAVIDTGNHLMHACVLAREIGLPCVVGVGDATTRLRTGELIWVDGTSGTVDRVGE